MGVEYNFFNHYRMLYFDLGKSWWAPHLNLREFHNGQAALEELRRVYEENKEEKAPEGMLENLAADLMTLCAGHLTYFFEIHHDMDDFDLRCDDEGYVCIGDRYDGIDPKYKVGPEDTEQIICCLLEIYSLCNFLKKDQREKKENGTDIPDRSQQIWSSMRKITVKPNVVSELLRDDWNSLISVVRGVHLFQELKGYSGETSARETLMMLRHSGLFYRLVRRFVPPVYPLAEWIRSELGYQARFLKRLA